VTDAGRRLRLTVGDAKLDDVGEGRARISPHLMDALDLGEGELLRVHGEHPILVSALPSTPDDEGLDLLRLDATQRRKAGVEIGDVVEAERHEVPPATQVRLVLVGHSGEYEPAPDDLRAELAAQPIVTGDTLSVAPKENTFDAHVNVLGLTVAEVVGSSTDCGALLARVVETAPSGVVQVTEDTEILLETGGTEESDAPRDVTV
jgi:transitional endoplasmic reticulum ATPase